MLFQISKGGWEMPREDDGYSSDLHSHYDRRVCAEQAAGTPSPVAPRDVSEEPLLLLQVNQPCPMV